MSGHEINQIVRQAPHAGVDRRRSCRGKAVHTMVEDADKAASIMSLRHDGEDFQAYPCRYGRHWHVGHAIYDDVTEDAEGFSVDARPVYRLGRELNRTERVEALVGRYEARGGETRCYPAPRDAKVGDLCRPSAFLGLSAPVTLAGETIIELRGLGMTFVLRGDFYQRTR